MKCFNRLINWAGKARTTKIGLRRALRCGLWCGLILLRAASAGAQESSIAGTEILAAVRSALAQAGVAEADWPSLPDLSLPVASRCGTFVVDQLRWDPVLERELVRIRCASRGEGAPFLVVVQMHPPPSSRTGIRRLAPQLNGPDLVRPGERATLILHRDGMQLSVAVTCMERGKLGATIRVRVGQGPMFRARVAGAGRLDAVL